MVEQILSLMLHVCRDSLGAVAIIVEEVERQKRNQNCQNENRSYLLRHAVEGRFGSIADFRSTKGCVRFARCAKLQVHHVR